MIIASNFINIPRLRCGSLNSLSMPMQYTVFDCFVWYIFILMHCWWRKILFNIMDYLMLAPLLLSRILWPSFLQFFSARAEPTVNFRHQMWCLTRVILIEKSFLDQIVHVPKLFSLLHWSQNIFCFLCSSTPSHGDSIYRLQWEFQWENEQNK